MRRSAWVGLSVSVFVLGCGGVPSASGPTEMGRMPNLLVFDPTDGCTWRLEGDEGPRLVLAKTSACPDDVWFSPDFTKAIALGGGKVWHGPLASLAQLDAPAGAEAVWPVGGVPALGKLDYGDAGATLITWDLQGTAFVESGKVELTEVDLMMNPLAKHPSKPMNTDWISFASLVDANQATSVTSMPSAALKPVLGIEDDETEIGQLAVGGKLLTYSVVFGDSLHAVPPIAVCPDAGCSSHTMLQGPFPDQLAIVSKDTWFLVTAEYTGKAPRVYHIGRDAPVFVGSEQGRAAWAPPALLLPEAH